MYTYDILVLNIKAMEAMALSTCTCSCTIADPQRSSWALFSLPDTKKTTKKKGNESFCFSTRRRTHLSQTTAEAQKDSHYAGHSSVSKIIYPRAVASENRPQTVEESGKESRRESIEGLVPPFPSLLSPKRVVLVRHGQSTWNAEGRIQGSSDFAILTPKGEIQAETSRQMLLSDSFDVCFHRFFSSFDDY